MKDALWRMPAAEQAEAVRRAEVSAVELVDSHLERIAEVNPRVNAVTRLMAESAREAAARTDRRRAAGEELGPLAGVPFTVKESTAVEGVPTTFGTPRFRNLVAPADAPPVARLRAAGAIPVGRGNIPTLILAGMHTRSELFGDTVNPWDGGRTPGGSSGGDAVAVATGMAALGLGSDSGGSVRIPAQFCGVAGLKPSTGRFPADHRVLGPDDPGPASQALVTDGPLARSVRDLRLAYEVLVGTDPRDPRAVPVPAYGEPLPGRVKVAVVADPGGHGVHPAVRGAVATAADALRDAGYDVREVRDVPRLDEALEAYGRITLTEFAPTWPAVRGLLGEGGDRYIAMAMERTPPASAAELMTLMGTWLNIRRSWAEFLDAHPLLLGPVFTEPPVEPGLESRDRAGRDRVATGMRLCTATSFVGVPAVAVPTGTVDGLPCGVQIVGRAFREDLCLDAAQAIEDRLGTLTPVDPRT
ncbi:MULTISPECIES: amidase [Streptomyces]|uniref:Acylamidase n=1 Tax=Streptomyces fradiae ATCC 10745 = DSM 40063 TaxID=1319510 RepID=A0A1Y2NVD3_STRFR|nr:MULTISPECIES: amidase [Streptomyces]KAF0647646.1 indoleacetamide hydrolase [Streptomyces fradiae ATCC 10745 = DSM 40063]OSY51492.1 Acylamidase [Streptomyces fradiae ATCC 10745 = DSM 40063]QEV15280.1 indole acetimide hydrolase [Streptomyces fradiae ATCC 10745 = DSM 40063]UQS32970.1 indole acetimide hydrolase [Streptomyces fradiae]